MLRNPSIRTVVSVNTVNISCDHFMSSSHSVLGSTDHKKVFKHVCVKALQWFWLDIVPACLLHRQATHVPPMSTACICSLCTDEDSTKNFTIWMDLTLSHKRREENEIHRVVTIQMNAVIHIIQITGKLWAPEAIFTCVIMNSSTRGSSPMSPWGRSNRNEVFHTVQGPPLVSLLLITVPSWCRLITTWYSVHRKCGERNQWSNKKLNMKTEVQKESGKKQLSHYLQIKKIRNSKQ